MPSLIASFIACRYIFRLEEAECEAEGVACPQLTFADNSAVMTLMTSKPTGVFSLMNEEVLTRNPYPKPFPKPEPYPTLCTSNDL